MIYFKKVRFNEEDGAILEAALATFSEERESLAGFQPKVANLIFAKQIVKNNINYTRLMSRFDRFVPKLIFNTVTKEGNCICRSALSNRSAGVLILITGGIIANTMLTDNNAPHYAALIVLSSALTIFVLFIILECLQTQMKMKRAVSSYKLIQRIKLLHKV
ncbi:hypothetical protein [Mucilaginibacter ginsenosidivorax]|uniref:Uncharacterized protein n=1 Tax=Mucilaginibacter ginsenosidivorax TaxID=862126 RepID=A0A5B8W8F0_9SPHI|nr:hypothetical protein [Mucilaginibacter ginsenosidivorax]QEC79202.1 hypothetical protein FSB76_25825 [Mucilaginibacter ginsenosidivorax]